MDIVLSTEVLYRPWTASLPGKKPNPLAKKLATSKDKHRFSKTDNIPAITSIASGVKNCYSEVLSSTTHGRIKAVKQ
jgi:hypothetical protein